MKLLWAFPPGKAFLGAAEVPSAPYALRNGAPLLQPQAMTLPLQQSRSLPTVRTVLQPFKPQIALSPWGRW